MNIVGSIGKCPVCDKEFQRRVHWQTKCSKRCSNTFSVRKRRPPGRKLGAPSPIRVEGETAFVWLRDGVEASIDIADVSLVNGKRWRVTIDETGRPYAVSGYAGTGGATVMHRLLLNTPRGLVVDHKDGNGLNNRRTNIRNCTSGQNSSNRLAARLRLVGTTFDKNIGKHKASIGHEGRVIFLGYYSTKEEAAAAHQGASRVLKGEFSPWSLDDRQDQVNSA